MPYRYDPQHYRFSPDDIIEYFRKSRQDDPTQTVEEVLEKHRQIIDRWVDDNLSGPVPESNIYMERVSGETIKDRSEIQKVLSRIESPAIRAVLVVEPQRLSRGDLEDAGRIINAFRYSNTLIITPQRIYDLRDDADRMIFEMELKQGNQYLEYTKHILSRGRTAAAQKGAFIAAYAPFGYDKVTIDKVKTLKPNQSAKYVRRIFEMSASGAGRRTICNYLEDNGVKPLRGDHWHPETIYYILRNEAYIGKVKWNRYRSEKKLEGGSIVRKREKQEDYVLVDGLHEAIIPEELFYRVQDRFGSNVRLQSARELRNPLAGILRCQCGYSMVMRTTAGSGKFFVCQHQKYCRTGSVLADVLLHDVAEKLRGYIRDFEFALENHVRNEESQYHDAVANLQEQIDILNQKELKQWQDRYESDHPMPEAVFRKLNDDLVARRDFLQKRLNKLMENPPSAAHYERKIMLFSDALHALTDGNYSPAEQNELLKQCIRTITYSRAPGKTGGSHVNDLNVRPYSIEIDMIL